MGGLPPYLPLNDPVRVAILDAIDQRQAPHVHLLDEHDGLYGHRLWTYDQSLLEEHYDDLIAAARNAEDGIPFRVGDSRPAVRLFESSSFEAAMALAKADGSFADLFTVSASGPRLRSSALAECGEPRTPTAPWRRVV